MNPSNKKNSIIQGVEEMSEKWIVLRGGHRARVLAVSEDGIHVQTDVGEMTVEPSNVLMTRAPRSTDDMTALMLALWSELVFGRVTRVVTRAQDVTIWHTDVNGVRTYLGDNREVLKQFSREQARNCTFEYDFYFGFCGPLRQQAVPYASRAPGKFEEIGDDECGSSGSSDDEGDNLEKVFSYHFSSTNYQAPRLFDPSFQPTDPEQVWEVNSYSVITPRVGDLICGVPMHSNRGVSLARWFVCPEAFLHLCQYLRAPTTLNLERISRRQNPLFYRIAIESRDDEKCRLFFQALTDLREKCCV
jgi:hypothetical protein